jgi:putative nucleotidyltransferase with HDIG domain
LNVIIDSTATTIKSRRKIFESIKVPCMKKALIFNTPFEVCRERLIERNKQENSHKVPLEVQRKYLESFEVPFLEEGFDYIDIQNKPTHEESEKNILNIYEKTIGFNQNNKHHTQTLDEHLQSTFNYLRDNKGIDDIVLLYAGLYHDVGKLFTQTYKENDTNAHYYNHANVGAYWFLSNCGMYLESYASVAYLTQPTLDATFCINYHMRMYNLKTPKSKGKWKRIVGEEKFYYLELLYEADTKSH